MNLNDFRRRRLEMVKHLEVSGIRDPLVLSAMSRVERHRFFPGGPPGSADPYGDYPCEIGSGQTISQPFIVAYMIEKLRLQPGNRVLEIGTGSGYQAAILHEMGMEVFSVEMVDELYHHAKRVLAPEIHLRKGDGFRGWREEAPSRGSYSAARRWRYHRNWWISLTMPVEWSFRLEGSFRGCMWLPGAPVRFPFQRTSRYVSFQWWGTALPKVNECQIPS